MAARACHATGAGLAVELCHTTETKRGKAWKVSSVPVLAMPLQLAWLCSLATLRVAGEAVLPRHLLWCGNA
ncbi:hypothetical protein E2562_032267 [Oryza meyeriana var. granulata]|uniref:Uncharacterized protein n=1 Tax=Oryza meyeriana var. granulata TaxID=110450 RepID=A0A6G1F0G9_9ORYZ|nr:hypothetical protein E2562_032267 [Oryza meyeriana var. granulata]